MSRPFRTFLDLRNVPHEEKYPRLKSRASKLSDDEQLVIINASHPETLFDRLFRETSGEVNYSYRAYTVMPDVCVGVLNRNHSTESESATTGTSGTMKAPFQGSPTVLE